MAEAKTKPTQVGVEDYIAAIEPPGKREDAPVLDALFRKVTGEVPRMWGPSIIGYGQYHYRYDSGREGDAPAAGFAPRKPASTIYLADGVSAHAPLFEQLGPHTTGVGCLYVKDLTNVDLTVLEAIIAASYATLTEGDYGLRARDGGS